MNVFLVLIIGLHGTEPWGIYSDIDKAVQAQEDCEALNSFALSDGPLTRAFKKFAGQDTCEVWEYQLDRGRIGQPPSDVIEVEPPVVDPNAPPIPAMD